MIDYAGLSEEDIEGLCEELEPQLEAGLCDDSVCAGSLALVRALPELMHVFRLERHRRKVCQQQLRGLKRKNLSAKKHGKSKG